MSPAFKSLAGVVGSIAPTLATMLGGPLAGAAVSAIGSALGLGEKATADDITKVVQAGQVDPGQLAAIRAADQEYQLKLKDADLKLAELNAATEASFNTAVVADVADARKAGSGNWMVMWIGVFILASFLVAMVLVLWGCWALISGSLKVQDAGVFAAITGLIGSIVGYFASNAQTVINFLFGGSLGGRKNADNLAAATAQLGTSLGQKANPTP